MAQDIFQWIFANLNADPTLAGIWGEPTKNPFSVAAEQQQGVATQKSPYCVYSSINRKDQPVYGNPRGLGNEWVFGFQIFSQGLSQTSGAKEARSIFTRIDDIFGSQMDEIGVQLVTLELGPIEHWLSLDRTYRILADYRFRENLCNLG